MMQLEHQREGETQQDTFHSTQIEDATNKVHEANH